MSGAAKPTRVYLVRHGETEWNVRGRLQGTTDVPLNGRGEAQARELAARLRDVAFDAAYTSDLRRARHTADVILGAAPFAVTVLPELRELCYGAWQGRTQGEWEADDRATADRWHADPWAVTFPDGESLDDVRRRAVPAWQRIVGAHPGERVLVAAHGHVNRVLLSFALGLPDDAFWTIAQSNASCRVLDGYGAGGSATLLGDA